MLFYPPRFLTEAAFSCFSSDCGFQIFYFSHLFREDGLLSAHPELREMSRFSLKYQRGGDTYELFDELQMLYPLPLW